jgi:NADH:ubiquinone oxidoreductase subunit E
LEANHTIPYSLQDFFKSLTKCLQTIIMEINDSNQSTFFSRKCILDYVLLLQKTLEWLKKSKKNMIRLKLDFSKSYHMVSWSFFSMSPKGRHTKRLCDEDQITICSCWGNYQLKWCTYTIFSHLSKC